MPPVTRLSCIFVDTSDLDHSVDFYTRCFGLTVCETQPGSVALIGSSSGTRQVVLRAAPLAGLAGLEFEAALPVDFRTLGSRLGSAGINVVSDDLPFARANTITLRDIDQTPIRIVGTDTHPFAASISHDRPAFLSHVVLNSPSPSELIKFYVDVLGFQVADAYEKDLLTFLRCHQPQHHCLGVSPGPRAGLNHFAMDCGTIDGVMKSVGRMRQAGHEPVWGPGRHAPGGNVFCYYADPVGLVAEFTCDLIQIQDDAAWTPQVWPRTAQNGNVWGTSVPSPTAVELMSGRGVR